MSLNLMSNVLAQRSYEDEPGEIMNRTNLNNTSTTLFSASK